MPMPTEDDHLIKLKENVEGPDFESFVVDDECHVIDRLNSDGPSGNYYPGIHGDDHRERILSGRLRDCAADLIVNRRPEETDQDGSKYRPENEESSSICSAIYHVIRASSLHTLEPSVSIQHRFDGVLKRTPKSLQDVTSLSLFRDDIERLLRDLYGDCDSQALDSLLNAIFSVAWQFTRFVRPELYQEHHNACDVQQIMPDGYSIGSGTYRMGYAALKKLEAHVREVRANRSEHSKYTVEFATRHVEDFIRLETADRDTNFFDW